MSICDMGELQGSNVLYYVCIMSPWLLNRPVLTRMVRVTVASVHLVESICFLLLDVDLTRLW